jgi:hypothetical protein
LPALWPTKAENFHTRPAPNTDKKAQIWGSMKTATALTHGKKKTGGELLVRSGKVNLGRARWNRQLRPKIKTDEENRGRDLEREQATGHEG